MSADARASEGWPQGIVAAICAVLLAGAAAGCDDSGADIEIAKVNTTVEAGDRQAGDDWSEDDDVAGEDTQRELPAAYDQVAVSDEAVGNEPYDYDDSGAEPVQTETIFKGDQLEQMVAPIALYPDSLMMQILIASTYPTEVVLADQWVKENKDLAGERLDEALAEQNWDDSVKSLVRTPDVLSRLANNLDWTRDLGDAFLAQKDDLLNAVQVMRNRACDLGNLKTTAEQKVIREPYEPPPLAAAPGGSEFEPLPPVEGEPLPAVSAPAPATAHYEVPPPSHVVRILPADPAVVHVPIYSPRLVYGPPPPTLYYPAIFAPSPGYVATAAISFGVGLSIGAFLYTDLDWYHRRVLVRRYPRGYFRPRAGVVADAALVPWRHSYRHRRGVAYRTPVIARRYSVVSAPGGSVGFRGGASGLLRDRDRDGGRSASIDRDGPGGSRNKDAMRGGRRRDGGGSAAAGRLDRDGRGNGGRSDGRERAVGGEQGKGSDKSIASRAKAPQEKGNDKSRSSVGASSGDKSRGGSVTKGGDKSRGGSVASKGGDKSRGGSVTSKGSDKSRGGSVTSKGSDKSRSGSIGTKGSSGSRGPSVSSRSSERSRGPSVSSRSKGSSDGRSMHGSRGGSSHSNMRSSRSSGGSRGGGSGRSSKSGGGSSRSGGGGGKGGGKR